MGFFKFVSRYVVAFIMVPLSGLLGLVGIFWYFLQNIGVLKKPYTDDHRD